jgi:hypothetical protein
MGSFFIKNYAKPSVVFVVRAGSIAIFSLFGFLFHIWGFGIAFVFVWFLTTIGSLIQYIIIDRKERYVPLNKVEVNILEKWLWSGIAIVGIIMMILPYTDLFHRYLYYDYSPSMLHVSRTLYLILGLELVFMNKYVFYRLYKFFINKKYRIK